MEHQHPAKPSPSFCVQPSKRVMQEIVERNTAVDHLIEDAKLAYLDTQADESAVTRLFIERGYSDAFAQWLAAEAAARETGATAERVEKTVDAKLM